MGKLGKLILIGIVISLFTACGGGDNLGGGKDDTTGEGGGPGSGGPTDEAVDPTEGTPTEVIPLPPGSGEPIGVLLSVEHISISVVGVGRTDNTGVTVQVVDEAGNLINENGFSSDSLNNIRISFITHPNGGEYLIGENGAGDTVNSTTTNNIELRTVNGIKSFYLQAGTYPGVVELQVEVLLDSDGNALTTPILGTLPVVSIASGPPHTIDLTHPIVNSVENLGGGVYRRVGTAVVTDRWGNPVPDGTVVNLGLLDSVIAEGTDGSITAGSNLLSSSATGNFLATITRNYISRGIEAKDRVLLINSQTGDRSRFVGSVTGSLTIETHQNYATTTSNLHYLVGSSKLGGNIGGEDQGGNYWPGSAATVEGLATFYVTYPSNINRINIGCIGYDTSGTYLKYDARFGDPSVTNDAANAVNLNSPQVYVTASSSDNDATTVKGGEFCFTPIAGFKLTPIPKEVAVTGAGAYTFEILVEDGGDTVPVPFEFVEAAVGKITRTNDPDNGKISDFTATVAVTSDFDRTEINGEAEITVTIGGVNHYSGDSAQIVINSGDGETTVTATVP